MAEASWNFGGVGAILSIERSMRGGSGDSGDDMDGGMD
jgi:hypothetical protein